MRILRQSDIEPFHELPSAMLDEMHAAGTQALECERLLAEADSNVVAEVLGGHDTFYQWDHYPSGDVFCPDSHAQYYYHSHPPDVRDNTWGEEHGHFHTFLRPPGFPEGLPVNAARSGEDGSAAHDAPAHLVAISMNFDGKAARLFTTNRWVTGEQWFEADIVKQLLRRFHIGHHLPSSAANTWVSAMLVLFLPTIEALLHARDAVVSGHDPEDDDTHVHDDRNLEVTSIIDIDVEDQLAMVEAARGR